MEHIQGEAITEDYWIIECPKCRNTEEYEGFFDSSEQYECKYCNERFMVDKIVFENGDEIR